MRFDCIVIGAGAAGLYCAMHAGQRGRRVLVLEHNREPGAKILISGGGRCNFTNAGAAPHCFISANPHFARSALSRHGPERFIALVERHSIAYYEKTLGQLFCEGARSSAKILGLLLKECTAAGIEIRTGCTITDVNSGDRFTIATNQGGFESQSLVIASGGLSIPKLGASGFAFDIARKFGVPIVQTRPGLVPLVFGEDDLAWMRPLAGVSTPVAASAEGPVFRDAALFTHRGLSGPAILQVSSYWQGGEVAIDWLADATEDLLVQRKRASPRSLIKTALAEKIPDRLAAALSERLPQAMLGDVKDVGLVESMRQLKNWRLSPRGDEGYAKAEVTVGGVDTNALSQQTLECRQVRGLYFIGECVDVTGWLGGYNFQWAWSSGWAAGQVC